ncbi:hypothetical protein [Novosphingobium sp. 17-62-19]|uniref:hypothetical protein n=1 Tax=Novosphingobium sp. 17-62-19 TaxID=1970406 RepID=UPI0025FBB496|nr:hypothetical protein [Novosphingobium sp. 17-62-19]HQS95076.1 hypothetical protein [Novosphingobium sp.]
MSTLLRSASDELDEVNAIVALGIRDAQQFNALEQRVQRIRQTLLQAMRGSGVLRGGVQ